MESVDSQHKSLRATLADRQSRRRVVLIYGRDTAPQLSLQQQQSLKVAQPDLDDRQMDVLVLVSSTLSESDRQFLTQRPFGLDPARDFQGWLIGKDGGVKQQFVHPVDPKELFRLVDSMPMRRWEMKN